MTWEWENGDELDFCVNYPFNRILLCELQQECCLLDLLALCHYDQLMSHLDVMPS